MPRLTAEPPGAGRRPDRGPDSLQAGPIERLCQWLCVAALLALVAVVGTEVVTRNLFGFSFQVSDELGGYLVVAIAFLSLCICQTGDIFHHVGFAQSRLPLRGQLLSRLLFDLLCLATSGLVTWQLARLEVNSWASGDMAPTALMTPLWLPQSVMPFGFAALTLAVLRSLLRHARRLAHLPPRGAAGG